jgi:hypothetical protein
MYANSDNPPAVPWGPVATIGPAIPCGPIGPIGPKSPTVRALVCQIISRY